MDPLSSRRLCFLLSLSAIPLSCADGSGESEAEASGTGTGNEGSTTAATTGTSSGTSAGSGTETTSTTDSSGGLCEAFAEWLYACFPDFSDVPFTQAYCELTLAEYAKVGPECVAAEEARLTCLIASTCGSGACMDELTAVKLTCLPEPGEACVAYANKFGECYGYSPRDIAYTAGNCQSAINGYTEDYGAACGAAYEDVFACIGMLDCADLGDLSACSAEFDAIDLHCRFP